jgi:hypothetical protein
MDQLMLQRALSANALFSAVSGLVMLLFSPWLQTHLAAPGWFWITGGVGLLGFSAMLIVMARQPMLARQLTPMVVAADTGWVLSTFIALVVFLPEVTATGASLVGAVNVVVALLAAAQLAGYRAATA